MNTTKQTHTPGPWYEMTKGENEYQSAICQETTGKTVALTYTSNDADARLIAASPMLLEALKALYYANAETFEGLPNYDGLWDAAARAIAQAEGGIRP